MSLENDDFLNDFFADARAVRAPVSGDLMARVLADAERRSPMRTLLDMIGGWPTMGGLVAAGVAGLWIGITSPSLVSDYTALLTGDTVEVDLWSEISIGSEGWVDG